jgi:hypothetical protein
MSTWIKWSLKRNDALESIGVPSDATSIQEFPLAISGDIEGLNLRTVLLECDPPRKGTDYIDVSCCPSSHDELALRAGVANVSHAAERRVREPCDALQISVASADTRAFKTAGRWPDLICSFLLRVTGTQTKH